ncbi:hypothetical protein K9N68_38215 (plasmid) [Kovacikia minuta CCNUW1]|uniref:hypothetical protein n=1 Tax=Kovacikia minuta TaxID=2931930 RepID=UPI001CCD1D1A|nr:hypothetical protein [Kovacikia minuta]UBF30037.1 hypothetical protein K9N68_38215 [Kovacikia minuta CCNUW1]
MTNNRPNANESDDVRKTIEFSQDLLQHIDNTGEYFTVKLTGKSGMSHRGLGRFIEKHHSAIGRWVRRIENADPMQNDLPKPFKRFAGKRLTLAHYEDKEGRVILEDQFCSAVVEYFAWWAPEDQQTDEAKNKMELLRDIGMRKLIHLKTGWKSQDDFEQEYTLHRQRYDARSSLKDVFRVELMDAVKEYQKKHKTSRRIFWEAHDAINKRIQGLFSKEIKKVNGLSERTMIRDHYETRPLIDYSAINRLASNMIRIHGIHPVTAINHACDLYLTPEYIPQPLPIVENVFKAEKRLQQQKKALQLPAKPKTQAQVTQLVLF